ncbi:5-formyltetrahydrofolate cyclo-ligase [Cristinia sonorae]|uniref:5-formyltetrahydrofolate cyclo-ligase n=1 Tax=Cristinia sonorae TaxID=1940300 RepID=A0A8K0UFZ7_9AGAR|nr:5-formyltetrahydrofolate cyclo-ligase [Cristinia sonorae]
MATLQSSKKAMRKAVSSILRSLSNADIQAQSHAVTNHVLSSPWFQRCRTVSCYLSMPTGELDTSSLIAAIMQSGKTLYVPRIDVTVDGRMDFVKTFGEDDIRSFPSGLWGIKEPTADWNGSPRPSALETSDEPLDLILMPGVVFDHSLSRLGHGKGYYDRFITNYTSSHRGQKPLLVALALREQILEAGKVPVGEHDWKVDVIIGPEGVVPGGKSGPLSSQRLDNCQS